MSVSILISCIILAALRIVHVSATGSKLTITKVTCEVQPNDYVKECEGWAENGLGFLNASFYRTEISDLIISYSLSLGQGDLPEQTVTCCDAITDETIKKKFIKYVEPRNEFPEDCPSWIEGIFLVDKFTAQPEDIPPYSTDGQVIADIYFSVQDGDPFLQIHGEGDLTPIVNPASAPF